MVVTGKKAKLKRASFSPTDRVSQTYRRLEMRPNSVDGVVTCGFDNDNHDHTSTYHSAHEEDECLSAGGLHP